MGNIVVAPFRRYDVGMPGRWDGVQQHAPVQVLSSSVIPPVSTTSNIPPLPAARLIERYYPAYPLGSRGQLLAARQKSPTET